MAGFFGFDLPARPLRAKQGEYREWAFVRRRRNPDTGELEPEDLDGATIEAQVRDRHGELLAVFSTFVTKAQEGRFSIVLSSLQTSEIPAGSTINSLSSHHVWDGFITMPNGVRKAFVSQSPFIIEPAVTR